MTARLFCLALHLLIETYIGASQDNQVGDTDAHFRKYLQDRGW